MEGPNTRLGEDPKREYADERDMDRFWETARLEREPARQWWYIPLILGLILISIPWSGLLPSERIVMGLPVWIWIPLGSTLGLSILTAFAILRFWADGDSDSD